MPNKPVALDLASICTLLEAARVDRGFQSTPLEEITTVLMTAFPFRTDLADTERRIALFHGISNAAQLGPITPATLESSVKRKEQELLSQPLKKFVLASNLSFYVFGRMTPRRFIGNVELVRYLPDRFLKGREAEAERIPEEDRLVRDYVGSLVRVDARSPAHAFDLAIERLDLLRGIWNFSLNRWIVSGSSSDPTRPINRIRMSRVHTLHDPDGTLATSTYRFYPEFRQETFPRLDDEQWRRMQRFLRSAQQRLPRISYRAEIERAFVHYGRALDATDMESAFLKLWSVFEFISGLGGEDYNKLIARAQFLFAPDPMTRMILDHLRYQRNEATHLGHPQSEMRPLVYQLKRYVEQMIAVHLAMGRHFKDLDEAGRFMDLKETPEALRRRIELIEHALRFRRVKKRRRKKRT